MYDFETTEIPSARDFVERELKAEPTATYAEIRDRAARLGLAVPPFLYGAARRNLGLPPRPEPVGQPTGSETGPEPPRGTEHAAPTAAIAEISHESAVATLCADLPEPTAGTETPGPAKARKGKSGFDFAVEMLKLSPDISYQDLRDRAWLAGLKVPPIVYGRAKALLGLVPTKPRQRRQPPPPAPRMLRQVDSASMLRPEPDLASLRQIEQLVASVRQLEGECQRLRAAIGAALTVVEAALDERIEG